ncbi:hypothetical protein CN068_35055, partial [Sinorhizobium meliloti]
MHHIGANCAGGTSQTNGETWPKRFKPHSSKAVAFDARSHVGAGLRKADATIISPPSTSSRSKFLRPLASSGLSGILCGGPVSSVEEPLAKDDGELCLCLDPF